METTDQEFLQKLLAMFKIEAQEHLDAISSGLSAMTQNDVAGGSSDIESIYREAHSLKGAARSVNLGEIVSLCQAVEDVFSALKQKKISFSASLGDLLQQTVDLCYEMVADGEFKVSERGLKKDLIRQLNRAASEERTESEPASKEHLQSTGGDDHDEAAGSRDITSVNITEEIGKEEEIPDSTASDKGETPTSSVVTPPSSATPETIRVSGSRLDDLLLQVEETISLKLAASQRAEELKDLENLYALWKKEHRRKGASDALDRFHSDFEARLSAIVRNAEYDRRTSAALVDKLLDDMKRTLMLPFTSLLTIFPRFVRELARSMKKNVALTIKGGQIEVDKRVLEELKDPLLHLVRNCVDHGIEEPEQREKKEKPSSGSISISIASREGKIEIVIADDGRGIDPEKMKQSAVMAGLLSQEVAQQLSEEEARSLIFQSGVTTSPIITDISGRGLGLAIVREKVEKINGTVQVDSRPGEGARFTIEVPLTLVTFRGTLVRVFDRHFVLPSVNVDMVARVESKDIQTVENRETIVIDEHLLGLVSLADVMELQGEEEERKDDVHFHQVVVLKGVEKSMAFEVDEVLREQEVLVKPLGKQLSRLRNIAAATVLGNNSVVPILNVADLLKSAMKGVRPAVSNPPREQESVKTVLVVEDSVTARSLLKNILESAGYKVMTAIDGVDGLTALKSGDFDIVVSDVQMPRMDGFALTTNIREDKELANLPVILVTALESREDRERGIDAGANAYIVKSSFDQSNLLEVMERLI